MIGLLLMNLSLTMLWLLLNESAGFLSLGFGFLVSAVITSALGAAAGRHGYLGALWAKVRFVGYFLRILVQANLEVMKEILTPGFSMKPRLIRYETPDLTPGQLTVLASAITLTPGTLSVDCEEDGTALYIHAMYADDPSAAVAELDALKNRILLDLYRGC
ncbi:MAG: Na+/H+ antiporter subunit E [Planctomycetota bacterium]